MNNAESKQADLSVTALYTSAAWAWGGFSHADLLLSPEAKRVFQVTNAALNVASPFIRQASLRHSLLHRHAAIDYLLREAKPSHVLELASGLSRRGVAVSTDPSVDYTEIDLPHVVTKKRALLERTVAGKSALARANLHLLEGDVLAFDFDSLGSSDDVSSSLVIAEGLFMYLDAGAQGALLRAVASHLQKRGGGRFVFDWVPFSEQPPPGKMGRGLEWLMKRFTKGKSFEKDARTRFDLEKEILLSGFTSAVMIEPCEKAHAWGLPCPDAVTQQLIFQCSVPSSP